VSSVKTVVLSFSTLIIATLPHTTAHSSSEVRLAKMTSSGLYLNSVAPAPLQTWSARPRRTHYGKSGLHIWVERSCVAWRIYMLIGSFTGT